jgi:phosphoribosylglycinamide formyltransferase 1
MLTIAAFGSGGGSNFRAILASIEAGTIPGARIGAVISDRVDAGILEIARTHGLPALHIAREQFPGAEEYAGALLDALRGHGVTFVVLAGYLKLVPQQVVSAYRGRMLNIHPALLPRHGGRGMYGHRVHEAVLAAGDSESGATVHLVTEEYDRGPIVLQKSVPVLPGDSAETLAARVLAVEHEIYSAAIRLFAEHT